MPKFFGPDTVLWYYSDKPPSGYVFYVIAGLAVGVATWPFLRSPSKIIQALRGDLADRRQEKDFDMLGANRGFFCPVSDDVRWRAELFLWRMFLFVSADRANVGTFLFFVDGVAAPRWRRRARRDFGNWGSGHDQGWTGKSDRNSLPV